jgi:NTE family protein
VERYGRKTVYYNAHNKRLTKLGKKISPYTYNKETLGFRLDSAKEIAVFRDRAQPVREAVEDFFDYGWALMRTVMSMQTSFHLHSDDWQRTIYIDTLGVGTTDFGLTPAKSNALVRSGKRHTEAYFKWFDDLSSDPAINHPRVRG